MVKILASGEIVPDDDPRVAGGGDASNRPGSAIPRHRQVYMFEPYLFFIFYSYMCVYYDRELNRI